MARRDDGRVSRGHAHGSANGRTGGAGARRVVDPEEERRVEEQFWGKQGKNRPYQTPSEGRAPQPKRPAPTPPRAQQVPPRLAPQAPRQTGQTGPLPAPTGRQAAPQARRPAPQAPRPNPGPAGRQAVPQAPRQTGPQTPPPGARGPQTVQARQAVGPQSGQAGQTGPQASPRGAQGAQARQAGRPQPGQTGPQPPPRGAQGPQAAQARLAAARARQTAALQAELAASQAADQQVAAQQAARRAAEARQAAQQAAQLGTQARQAVPQAPRPATQATRQAVPQTARTATQPVPAETRADREGREAEWQATRQAALREVARARAAQRAQEVRLPPTPTRRGGAGSSRKRGYEGSRRQLPAVPPKLINARRGRVHNPFGQADRVNAAAFVVAGLVGISLIAMVERSMLAGELGGALTGSLQPSQPAPAAAPKVPAPAPSDQRSRTPAAPNPAENPAAEPLTARVRTVMLAQRGQAAQTAYGQAAKAPLVGAARLSADRTWALGTVAIPVPDGQNAAPQVAVYAAHLVNGQWNVVLSGGPGFLVQLRQMPTGLVSGEERRLLGAYHAATANTRGGQLFLPWRVGGLWTMTTASSGTSQGSRPLGAVSFRGADGRVLAAGPGRLYHFCENAQGSGGLVMVIHPNGLASTYNQMTNVTRVANGAPVNRGALLGRLGTTSTCGGAAADRPQVRFALRAGADDVPLDGRTLSGWTFRERADPLRGWAERAGVQVLSGGGLLNLGAAAVPLPTLPDLPGQEPTGSPSPAPSINSNQEGTAQ